MPPASNPLGSVRLRGGSFRATVTWGLVGAAIGALFLVHAETAWLVLLANLFGLAVAWFVTRVCGLPRDGALRSERSQGPPIAGRIAPDA
ncbi:hypothetical protein Pla123a_13000 [Posidoniimonas polymericola]|uniref:Uncharacterized protein n=1 Tax=Posidoniimonas polymericola TaxID=2528002 RepID=A0A5C5YVF7_9BACT|nr:hypothetical protein [Posidoniimonas polymericola]TWT78507.1 hypothetical protein Pla123a_13000 [Posidoniimonas polymericola]